MKLQKNYFYKNLIEENSYIYKLSDILLNMVRIKQEWKTITVSENVYDRLEEERKHFEETIGGGKWSMNDTLTELIKILDQFKDAGGFEALQEK